MARVEDQATVDQSNCDVDVLVEVAEGEGSERKNVGVVWADTKRLSGKADTGMPDRLQIFGPVHHRKSLVTVCRQGESRAVMRITFDPPPEQVKRLGQPVLLIGEAMCKRAQVQIIGGQIGSRTA